MPESRSLEIGPGTLPQGGYEHLDIFPGEDIDIVCDAANLSVIEDNTYNEIYCRNIIEHFPFGETVSVLKEWKRVLKSGGKLVCDTPMLMGMIEDYINGINTFVQLVGRIYGGQENPHNFHYAGFDEEHIINCFSLAGFKEIKTRDKGKYSVVIEGTKP